MSSFDITCGFDTEEIRMEIEREMEDDYSDDEGYFQDKYYYYGKNDLKIYIKSIIEFINRGGK